MIPRFGKSMRTKYITRAGEPVRMLCVDGPDPAGPFIGLLPGRKGVTQWGQDGKEGGRYDPSPSPSDLMTVSEYKKGKTIIYSKFTKNIPIRLRKGERL